MQAITIDETASCVSITNRTLPTLLQGVYAVAMIAALAYALYEMLPAILAGGDGVAWLPFLEELPPGWRAALLLACMMVAFAFAFAPLLSAAQTLLYGRIWTFDDRLRLIVRNDRTVGRFDDWKEIIVEGNFRSEPAKVALALIGKDGERVDIATGTLDEAQLTDFHAAAQAVSRRTRIFYRKIGLRPWAEPWWDFPTWW